MTEIGFWHLPKRHRGPLAAQLADGLRSYSEQIQLLPGIQNRASEFCLVRQLIDSIRRVRFVRQLAYKNLDAIVGDPTSDRFDPLMAAVISSRESDEDNALWLTFLAVHFGKHAHDGWSLVRSVYGCLGDGARWDWDAVARDPDGFRQWLAEHQGALRQFRFSNHRQYESLAAYSTNGTGSVIASFVVWRLSGGSLSERVRAIHQRRGQHPGVVFDALYRELSVLRRFGRLARFDFLTMLGKLGIAPIEPPSPYLRDGATGPYRGLCLLITGHTHGAVARRLADEICIELGEYLDLGMQELEDALCNWQKSPTSYQYFKG